MTSTVPCALAVSLALLGFGCISTRQRSPNPADNRSPSASRSGAIAKIAIVRVTTDVHGKIVAAVLVKSTGSEALDRDAVANTKARWHGAVSSTTEVPVKYETAPRIQSAPAVRIQTSLGTSG